MSIEPLIIVGITFNAILAIGWVAIIIWLTLKTKMQVLVLLGGLFCLSAGSMIFADFYFDPDQRVLDFDVSWEVSDMLVLIAYWIFGMKYYTLSWRMLL
jgi:hypothetical protein